MADTTGFDETGDILPQIIVEAGGGPEDPYTDVAAGIVEILEDLGLGDLFGFGGGPSLTPNQLEAQAHGIDLSSPLQGTPGFQTVANTTSVASENAASALPAQVIADYTGNVELYWTVAPDGTVSQVGAPFVEENLAAVANGSLSEIVVTAPAYPNAALCGISLDCGFNFAAFSTSPEFLRAEPWLKLAAGVVITAEGAYLGANAAAYVGSYAGQFQAVSRSVQIVSQSGQNLLRARVLGQAISTTSSLLGGTAPELVAPTELAAEVADTTLVEVPSELSSQFTEITEQFSKLSDYLQAIEHMVD